VSMIVKAEGPSGRAKINSDGPKHALGLVRRRRQWDCGNGPEDGDQATRP